MKERLPFLQKLQGISSCCLQHGVLLQARRFCCTLIKQTKTKTKRKRKRKEEKNIYIKFLSNGGLVVVVRIYTKPKIYD